MLSSRPAPVASHSEIESTSLFSVLAFGALLGLVILAPGQISGFWPAGYDFWPQSIWLLLSAGATLLLALAPDAKPRFDLGAKLLLAFLGWCALSIATAVYRHDAWLEWARLLGALVPFFAVRALWNERRAPWVLGAWVLGMAWVCLPAIQDFFVSRYPRQAGPFSNNNLFANALAMSLPLALILPILASRRAASRVVTVLACLPFLVCTAGLIVTSSKGGFLAALVALSTTAILIWRAKKTEIGALMRRHRSAVGAALLVLGIAALLAGKMIAPRLQAALGSESNSTLFRVYVWRSTLDMVRAKPLTGFGAGAFPHAYPRFAQVSYTRHAHATWLQIAAENGLPALLFLLGAIGVALRNGLKRLKTSDYPLVAGASGAVAASLVHGCVDSGLQTSSIAVFLALSLGILTAQAPKRSENETPGDTTRPGSRLSPAWLGATLLLAYGGNLSQKAASGENLRFSAEGFLKNGAPSLAVPKMREATQLDPTSARAWSFLGTAQEKAGESGEAAWQTAAQLQPTRGVNWANLARGALQAGNLSAAEGFYARALAADPLDTRLRLERAQFRLGTKNSAGYADLERILALKTAPYGLYEPVEQNVNLDFARATLLLAPELKRRGQTARLKNLIQSGLADCARAQRFASFNAQMRRESGVGDLGENADLEAISAALKALQITR